MSTATVLSLITIGVLLIIIACINYSNLTVAQMSSRAKVAGICKVLGSNRKRLMMQFFSETFILTSAAMVFSLLAADRILKSLNYLIGVPPGNWSFFNPVVLLFLLGVVALVSTIAGLYPAFLISKANPVAMIRNKGLGTGKGGLRFSRATVIFQFIIAQILIVCTLTIFGQLSFIESKDMGYDRDNILTVAIPENNAATLDRFGNELLRNADITQVSFASTSPGRSGNWVDAARNVDDAKVTTVTEMKSVDSSYIYLYGLELVSGRNFKAEESGLPVIVNQKLLEDLQFEDESQAIGAKLEFRGEDATIIGVVRDFHSDPIYQAIRPCVLEYNPGRFNMAGIKYRLPAGGERFRVRIEEMVDEVRSEWQALFPGQIFEYQFFDETIASYYREEKKVASLINIFTGIMLFICCLGIVGLIYHTTDRRSKELAVRKVVGASVLSIVTLLVRSFTNWVLVANLVAWPVAYLVMDKWLQNFAYRIDITWRIFVVAGFSALAIAILTMTAQVIRAALANPVESLRYE
jgi:putative ABC transport system permease protein